ncbi:hypothetical protein [Micromonospora sp. NPDC049645]|uniref:hypothetical protein n=1 Tax=Micromonospora sp. NPDC049645 TaxID=3155508 RepID=UPI00341FC442
MTGSGVYRVQLADFPGVWRVRNAACVGSPTAEALMHPGAGAGGGVWQIDYWFDPCTGAPQRHVTLPGHLDVDQAAARAVELVDAAALGVPGYDELLGAAMRVHDHLAELVRLHRPYRDPTYGVVCVGDVLDEPRDRDRVVWPCRTAATSALLLDVRLPR